MKRTNQKRNENENVRRPVGRPISISAVYSSKHNTIDFNKVFDQKMKEWEGLSIVKAKDVIEPFGYKGEAYKVPSSYYYTEDEVKNMLNINDKLLVLYFKDMADVILKNMEDIPYIAYCFDPTRNSGNILFVRNYLNYDEGLVMTKGVSMDDDEDLDKISKDPSVTEDLFLGIIAKKKLKDLVIDTCYKVAFNKAVENHYIIKKNFYKNMPITILKYFEEPFSELFGYGEAFGAVYTKTKLDSDGDRIIETEPEAKYVIVEKENGFVFKSLTAFNDNIEVKSVKDLEAFPNLMIPADFLRKLVIKDFLNTRKEEDNISKCKTNSFKPRYGVDITMCSKCNVVIKENIETEVYKFGVFRAPRLVEETGELDSVSVESNRFHTATGVKDLWILLDGKLDKIYLYNMSNKRVVDCCLATKTEFTNLLEIFGEEYLTEDTKDKLIDDVHKIKLNYYSNGKDNEGLAGFLKNCK